MKKGEKQPTGFVVEMNALIVESTLADVVCTVLYCKFCSSFASKHITSVID